MYVSRGYIGVGVAHPGVLGHTGPARREQPVRTCHVHRRTPGTHSLGDRGPCVPSVLVPTPRRGSAATGAPRGACKGVHPARTPRTPGYPSRINGTGTSPRVLIRCISVLPSQLITPGTQTRRELTHTRELTYLGQALPTNTPNTRGCAGVGCAHPQRVPTLLGGHERVSKLAPSEAGTSPGRRTAATDPHGRTTPVTRVRGHSHAVCVLTHGAEARGDTRSGWDPMSWRSVAPKCGRRWSSTATGRVPQPQGEQAHGGSPTGTQEQPHGHGSNPREGVPWPRGQPHGHTGKAPREKSHGHGSSPTGRAPRKKSHGHGSSPMDTREKPHGRCPTATRERPHGSGPTGTQDPPHRGAPRRAGPCPEGRHRRLPKPRPVPRPRWGWV